MARRGFCGCVVLAVWTLTAFPIRAVAQSQETEQKARLTAQRVEKQAWWATSGKPALTEYAGTQACRRCHERIATRQQESRMAHAAVRSTEMSTLDLNLSAVKHGIETEISTTADHTIYTAKRDGKTMTGRLLWVMGNGEIGNTFVLETGGKLFESQLSYFTAIQGLDLTPGHTWEAVTDTEHAFGERLEPADAQRCFSCHTTASTTQGRFDQTQATAGVTCESCHGPGARHVKAMEEGDRNEGLEAVFNPGSLNPVDLVDFCGACHRAPMDVKAEKEQSAVNIRFQPYRLTKSRCWTRPDARLACTACHSPHNNLVRDPASYDSKCLACHSPGKGGTAKVSSSMDAAKEPGCPVANTRCVTCHMRRYQLPQLHAWFTDHFIRIVKPGEPFPL